MKIVIACDPFSVDLKETVKSHLVDQGHTIADVGAQSATDKMYYIESASKLCRTLLSGGYDKGILFCGTGAGVSIVANKHKGIFCVPCESVFAAYKSAQLNNANVISMGYNMVGPGNACAIVDKWLASSFAMDSNEERKEFLTGLLNQVYAVEEENFGSGI